LNRLELYWNIDSHLLRDGKPSTYLNAVCMDPAFSVYPFDMLLRLKNTEQSPVHHPEGNVWNHTMLVVDAAAMMKAKSRDAAAFLWAALLHDIGKPSTTRIRKGRITAYDHDLVGAELARKFLSEFGDDGRFIDRVAGLVRYHMQILYVLKNLPFADIPGMRRDADIGEVALLGLCDRLGRLRPDPEEEQGKIRLFLQKVNEAQSL